eukprot:jgi/Chlat1/4061/Chrsp26S04004
MYEAAIRDGKAVASEVWLADCIRDTQLHDQHAKALYQPVPDELGVPDMDNCVVSITGYKSTVRDDVKDMVHIMRARYTGTLSKENTHLVCFDFSGQKFVRAQEFGVHTVNHQWLEDWSVWSPLV